MPKLDFAGSVTWLGRVPILVAIEKGFFKDEGLDVNVQVILSSSDRIRAVTSGAVAFSNLGRSTAISEMAHGNNSFFYFANVDDSPGSEGCWARAGFRVFFPISRAKGRRQYLGRSDDGRFASEFRHEHAGRPVRESVAE